MVDVAVREQRSRRVISNLKAEDFEVLDNGVPQKVDSVTYGKLPIDVTVALDVSYSVTGSTLERLRRGVLDLARDLGRQDRLKLLVFNQRVARTIDLTGDRDAIEKALRSVTAGGSTALLDAISVALVSSSAPDRRHLVVFFTDGNDSTSVTTPAALQLTARRARATLSFVMPSAGTIIRTDAVNRGGMVSEIRSAMGMPARVDPLYTALAQDTGGQILPVFANTDLSSTFRQVLDQFRSAYVLYFNAQGVERGGYHTLDVKVKREGAVVQARRGYWY